MPAPTLLPEPRSPRPHVVILGGGYAGVVAANRLGGRAGRRARITLVSDRDDLVHRVRLHEAAARGDDPRLPLRRLLHRRVAIVRARVERIDAAARTLHAADRTLRYDHLIYAVGSGVAVTAPGAREHAAALTSPEAALMFAARLATLPVGAPVVVVGGGLSAIETAAELAEAHPRLRVTLVGDALLPGWSDGGRDAIRAGLAELGVEVVLGARVAEVSDTAVRLADGARLPAAATVWATGFSVSPLARVSGLPVDAAGRLLVDDALRVVGHPEIVGAGDAVATPAPIRMGCASAMPMGAHAADVVAAALRGAPPRPHRFGFLLQCVSLGRRRGVVLFVDHDDRPTGRVVTGRAAAIVKELICRLVIGALRIERRVPGSYWWPGRGRAALVAPAPRALPPEVS